MEFRTYTTAFSIDADILDIVNLEGDENTHDVYAIKKSLSNLILKIYEEGTCDIKKIYRYKHNITNEILESDEIQEIKGFYLVEKVVKISLMVCKRR